MTAEEDIAQAHDVVSSVATKIFGGVERIGRDDIEGVRSVAALDRGAGKVIPTLDRSYLHSGVAAGPTGNIVRLVGMVQDQLDPEFYQARVNGSYTKYRDYVYNGNDNTGNDAAADPCADSNNLAERQPLVVVPVPFVSGWFRDALAARAGDAAATDELKSSGAGISNGSAAAAAEAFEGRGSKRPSPTQGPAEDIMSSPARKVHQGDEPSVGGDDVLSPLSAGSPSQGVIPLSGSTDNGADTVAALGGGTNDWWPRGCMGSDANSVPVLAKMYYDDDEDEDEGKQDCKMKESESDRDSSRGRLRLNDLVELIGVVHFDPMEADFAGQSGASGAGGAAASAGDYGAMGLDDLTLLDRVVVPPPSLFPRLHVLCYHRLDLDGMVRRFVEEEGKAAAASQDRPAGMMDLTSSDGSSFSKAEPGDARAETIQAIAKYVFGGNAAAAEALLMALMSTAEREPAAQDAGIGAPVLTPMGSTLGCASLNFVVPDAGSCTVLCGRLRRVLDQILPVVASADLSLEALAAGDAGGGGGGKGPSASVAAVASPAKNSDCRLVPTVMQLPRGSGLLINQGLLTEGRVGEAARRTLLALSDLTQKHSLPYRFDGMMDYPFEGDYRVIVVSNGATDGSGAGGGAPSRGEGQNKLLPCSMRMSLDAETVSQADDGQMLPPETANAIRSYISHCRALKGSEKGAGSSNNVALSREILAQAERDFVQRRVDGRDDNEAATTIGGGKEVGEEDFHRWLTITRLQARSRFGAVPAKEDSHEGGASASIEDWKSALDLDDAMRA